MSSELFREFIKQTINESLKDFSKATAHINYDVGLEDPFFANAKKNSSKALKKAKEVKRTWNKFADRAFIQSLIKIHWFNPRDFDDEMSLFLAIDRFLSMSRKNEISVVGYSPGMPIKPPSWNYNIGIQVDGWVTLAANNSDYVVSGYHGKYKPNKNYTSSGTPKRPTSFSSDHASEYAVDKESFGTEYQHESELIVDNWKPLRCVVRSEDSIPAIMRSNFTKRFKMPIVDMDGNAISIN